MPFILPPPPRQNNNIGDAITSSLMAYLAAREQTQERERQRELLQLQKNKAQLEAKHLDHQMKVEDFTRGLEGAQNALGALQGRPAPVGDISNGISGIAGAPTGPDPWSALEQGPGLAEQIIQGRVPQPMQQPPRMDTSGMQPVGQHPLIQFPVNLNGDTVGVRPQTDTEVMQGRAQEAAIKSQQSLLDLFQKGTVQAQLDANKPITPAEKARLEQTASEGKLNRQNQAEIAASNNASRERAAASSRGANTVKLSDLDPEKQAAIRDLARRNVEGQITTSDARGLLGGVKGGMGEAYTEALIETGAKLAPPKVREGLQDIARTENLLSEVHTMVNDIISTTNPKEKAEKSILLENYTRSVGTMLARGFGERGVVTDKDREAAIGLVPGWKSSNFAPGFAQDKLKILDELIAKNKKALTEGYFGKISEAPTAQKPTHRYNPATGQIELVK